MFDYALVHYAEIALKGGNRPSFERALAQRVREALADQPIGSVRRLPGRVVVGLGEGCDLETVKERLSHVLGVSWFTFAHSAPLNLERLKGFVGEKTASYVAEKPSMKVFVRRADKGFPLTSMELARELGGELARRYGLRASMAEPQLKVYVDILEEEAFLYFDRYRGPGGLPVGVSGRVLMLLSGGIDSAVASWLMMKRGCNVDYVHFHVFRDNTEAVNSKVGELLELLSRYSGGANAHFIPYYPFEFSTLKIPERYQLIIFRRFILRVAERLAQARGLGALVTGDNLGQVASQTLENLRVAEEAVSLPVLRPLLTYDKEETVELAKGIETYNLSIKPYKDCCSLITRHPATKAKIEVVRGFEEGLDLEGMIRDSLTAGKTVQFGSAKKAGSSPSGG